jgi:4-hydroxy-tetrahydrodipicolinate reductase
MAGAIVRAGAQDSDLEICAAVSPDPSEWQEDVPHLTSLELLREPVDVLVDFSMPDGTVTAAEWCRKSGVALLSGVTGLHQQALDALESASKEVPVLWSPSMSLGVNLLAQFCAQAAAILPEQTAITIDDVHHQWKKDAPSGTALMLGEAIDRARGQGVGSLAYASVREGEAVGRHTVTFRLAGEEMVLSHEARDRSIFAKGAISAAKWLSRQSAGLYTASDWLLRR